MSAEVQASPECRTCLGIDVIQQDLDESVSKVVAFRKLGEWDPVIKSEFQRVQATLTSDQAHLEGRMERAMQKAQVCPGQIEGECGYRVMQEAANTAVRSTIEHSEIEIAGHVITTQVHIRKLRSGE